MTHFSGLRSELRLLAVDGVFEVLFEMYLN